MQRLEDRENEALMTTSNSRIFTIILLAMLSAFGPMVTDMYLPGLPLMVTFFGTTVSMVQLGLTTSMLGLAAGQFIFGSFSDKYGRRPPLLIALVLFMITTVCCIFSPNIEIFIVLRFFQGIAGAGGLVLSRSIATDLHSGKELLKTLAVIGAILGIAPIAAPLIGGLIMSYTDWRGVFWTLCIIGIVLLMACIRFKESLPRSKRIEINISSAFRLYGTVFRNHKYRLYVLQSAFAHCVFFGNIASSPFIMQQHYGRSPFQFSIWFGFNMVSMAVATFFSVKFKKIENSVIAGTIGMLTMAIMEMIIFINNGAFWMYEAITFMLLFMYGLTLPTSTTLAMDSERENAGTASALLGAAGFIMGGLASPLVGLGNILISTGIVFLTGSVFSLYFALRGKQLIRSLQ